MSSVRHPQRKAALVAAARRVAAERGLAQTNVRAVAAAAEVSAGSVLYYYASFDDLLFESVESVLEEFYERRRRIADELAEPVDRIRALVAAGVPDQITDELRVVYESTAFLRDKPQYRPLLRSIVDRQVALYQATIDVGTGLGAFRPRQSSSAIARNIVALEDAYDLYPLFGAALDREQCRDAVLGYAALALDCDLR